MEALYAMVKDVDPATVEHVSIDNTNFLYDCGYPINCGAYYLYADDNTYSSLHRFIANALPPQNVQSAHIPVQFFDASGRGQGASGRWATLFGELGLTASDEKTAPRAVATVVVNNAGAKGRATAQWLAQYFGVSAVDAPPPPPGNSDAPASAGFVTVTVGTAEEASFHNLSGAGD